jgi:hypothetical protein
MNFIAGKIRIISHEKLEIMLRLHQLFRFKMEVLFEIIKMQASAQNISKEDFQYLKEMHPEA